MMTTGTPWRFLLLLLIACTSFRYGDSFTTLHVPLAFKPGFDCAGKAVAARSIPKQRRTLTVVHSAKVLPIAYSSSGAALLYGATKNAKSSPMSALVLTTTAALAIFNLMPTDNQRFACAKRASKKNPESSLASKYRTCVRIKIFGQVMGLLCMAWAGIQLSSRVIMAGAAILMGANTAFFRLGAGDCMHDENGQPDPMPTSKQRTLLTIDTTITAFALLATLSPFGSMQRTIGSGVYSLGVLIGALEGLAGTMKTSSKDE